MAGGNLSPRQKMINLMYLVFIAMLAMNMSKQVSICFWFHERETDRLESVSYKTRTLLRMQT